MVKQGTLLSELQSIVGKEHSREPRDDRDCAVDGLSPRAIVEPGTYEEVATVLRFANAARLAVIPRGGGRQTDLGNIPARYDIALGLARLDKIIEHEPADLTLTCQAGVTIGALGSHLARASQMAPLALDPDPADPLTVGGLLSLNMGDLRAAHGSPRDFTIGLRVVTTDGRISRAGGKVVKNVAGYDLCKLYIGSRGTLALITEATFKLFPRPPVNETASFEFADFADACRAAREAEARGLSVVDAHVIRPPHATGGAKKQPLNYVLHLTCAGEPGAVERSRQEATELATGAGGEPFDPDRWRGRRPPTETSEFAEHPLSIRVRMLPTRVPDFIGAMEYHSEGPFDATPILGEVTWVSVKAEDQRKWIELARAAASRVGGTVEVMFCSPELKRQVDVFGPPPPSFPLMRAIKQQFDPNNILSPGRFVGRL